MTVNSTNLIWIDLEMTGLNPDHNLIIEIATIITDKNLTVLAEGPVLAINQPRAAIEAMDEWNQQHHGSSGLIERVTASKLNEQEAEQQTLAFLKQWVAAGDSPICGNSICQDRRFLYRYMPTLEAYFHYRNLDVSTLKILASQWMPEILDGFKKQNAHRAQDDIIESIAELNYYRRHLLNC